MYIKFKKRTFEIIQSAKNGDIASKIFDLFIIALIIINTISVIAETFKLPPNIKPSLNWIEIISVIIFTIEYILRLWTANFLYPDKGPIMSRIRYIFSFMAIIDLLAILPFYIPFVFPVDLRVLRTLRVVRLFRLFKINRYTNALSTIGTVFKSKANQLISSMIVVSLLMIIASVMMYNVESAAQPDKFQNAFSGLWWAIATLTTVGYGDIYPITVAGRVLSAIIAFLGIGLVAVPTGIISAGFIEHLSNAEKEKQQADEKNYCPYCGHKLDK